LLEQARFYLAHQELAERIRRAGLERARREHTWQHRFAELFAVLGLKTA
ncbi:MAG: glycosyltransferase family 1 protein, partial [Chloroflexi bacterium]|nr:glycosyltransferase family 1 protein [Chloroflexota bacterium]